MSLTPEQQAKVIQNCKKGDRKSQHLLFETYYSKMLSVCMRYTKDADTAQEVCQTGFIKIFEKLDLYNSEGSFEGWMRRLMVNTSIDKIRRSKKELTIIDDDSRIPDGLVEDDEDDFVGLQVDDVVEAVQKLSPAYRAVFNLYVMENTPHKEIGEILGITEGTSKSNLAKAKRNLRELLHNKRKHHA